MIQACVMKVNLILFIWAVQPFHYGACGDILLIINYEERRYIIKSQYIRAISVLLFTCVSPHVQNQIVMTPLYLSPPLDNKENQDYQDD